MGAFESRPAKMLHRYCSPPSCVRGKIINWYLWVGNQSLALDLLLEHQFKWFNTSVGALGLKHRRHLCNRDSKRGRGSLDICSDIHSLIHPFNQHLLNTFFILAITFLLTTSGMPVSHPSAHVSAESLLDRIVTV